MKKLFIALLLSLAFNTASFAQAVPKATAGEMTLKNQTVEFTVLSEEAFYVGGNVFVLHIGDKMFDYYRQEDIDGKGKLVFLIPENDFKNLAKNELVFLRYGAASLEEESLESLCKSLPNLCKKLGNFHPENLAK